LADKELSPLTKKEFKLRGHIQRQSVLSGILINAKLGIVAAVDPVPSCKFPCI
jgi:hypothetical protein